MPPPDPADTDEMLGFEAWLAGADIPPPPAPGPAPTPPGYTVERELGRGAMGIVYKAHDSRLNRPVALKMVLAGRHAHPRELGRFLYEAETIAAIDDPHVVRVYESGVFDGQPYFVMEFVPGGSLHDLLHPRGRPAHPLPPAAAAALVRRLAGGVQAAHDRGLVHRDIKPRNVLLASAEIGMRNAESKPDSPATQTGLGLQPAFRIPNSALVPKLADFGLARRLDSVAASGGVAGTPHYMAPEQTRDGGQRVGPASDVWALGCVLYECLTGRVPFPGDEPYEVVRRVVEESPPSPRTVNGGVPRDLSLVVLKCLEKDPHRRYPTALALADELGRFLAGEPVKVRPTTAAERCWRWARKRPAIASLTAAVVALLAAIVAVVVIEGEKAKRDRDAAIFAGQREAAARTAAEEQLLRAEWLAAADRVRMAAARWGDGYPAEARRLLAEVPAEWRGWEHDYLSRLTAGGRLPVHRHSGPATALALGGGRAATAGGDTLQLWEADGSPGPALIIGPHTAVAVTADGMRAAVGTDAGTVAVWDVPGRRKAFDAPSHRPDTAVTGLAFRPTTGALVSVGEDGRVLLSHDGGLKADVRKHPGGGTCVAWRPEGDRFVTGGADGVVWVWDGDGKPLRAAPDPHPGGVTAVAFRPNGPLGGLGQRLATAGPGRLCLREPNGTPVGRPVELPDTPAAVAFGPDAVVYVAGSGGVVRGFSAEDGRPEPVALRHPQPVAGLALRGDRVVTAGADGAVRSWHPRWPAHGRRLGDVDAPLRSAAFTASGAVLTLTGRRLSVADPAGEAVWTLLDDAPDAAALTAEWAVVGVSGGGTVTQHFGNEPVELLTDAGAGTGLVLDRSGRCAARGTDDGRLTMWELGPTAARTVWEHLPGQPASVLPVTRVRSEPAAGLVLASHADGTLAGYDLLTGATRFSLAAGGTVADAVVSPDGSTLVAAVGEAVVVWSLTPTGPEKRATRDAHTDAVTAVAFGPRGDRLATGGADGTVRVWDAASGDELLVLREADGPVATVEFDPAGRRLLALTRGGVARVWDAGPTDPAGDAARRVAALARLERVPASAGGPDVTRLRAACR